MKNIIKQSAIIIFRALAGFVYIFIICPWGLFYKLIGINPLRETIDKTKNSYWKGQAYEDHGAKIS